MRYYRKVLICVLTGETLIGHIEKQTYAAPGGYGHIPVMPEEVLALLLPAPGDIAVDGTVGLGGHSRMIGEILGPNGRLACFDRDAEALQQARQTLTGLACHVDFVNRQYEFLDPELDALGIGKVNRILMDLGVSSLQLDKPERGFSFRNDGPLDMRMNQNNGPTAADIVNSWPEEKLADLFWTLGEEKFSRRLAKSIGETRAKRPIQTTGELSRLAEESVPFRGRIHPATKMFQALRMEVNDELGTLSRGLAAAGRRLAPGGRLAVITFHSLEDRLVKRTFLRWAGSGAVTLVTRHARAPGREEEKSNRRARSAKLRVVEKI